MAQESKRIRELQERFPDGPLPPYQFKLIEEAVWFVAVAMITVLAQELLTFDGNAVGDVRTWIVALISAMVRAAAGGFLAWLAKRRLTRA